MSDQRVLAPHIAAWLGAHPERDAAWLAERQRDGFDVHHLDSNHENNAPDNLVLIEHSDHIRMHGATVPSVPLHVLGRQARRDIRRARYDIVAATRGEGLLARLLKMDDLISDTRIPRRPRPKRDWAW